MAIAINWGSGGNSAGAGVTTLSTGLGNGTGGAGSFVSGDIIVIVAATRNTGTTISLANFTVTAGSVTGLAYLRRVCDGSANDPTTSSVSVAFSASGVAATQAFTITGGASIDPSWTAWTTGATATAITLANSGDIIVVLQAGSNSSGAAITSTPPGSPWSTTGITTNPQISTLASGSSKGSADACAAYKTGVSSGSTGTAAFTDANAVNDNTVILGFSAPAGGAAVIPELAMAPMTGV